jgi:DndB-like DNA-sulfur modification-associated protein
MTQHSFPEFRTPLVAVCGQAGDLLATYLTVLPVGHLTRFLNHDPRERYRKQLDPAILEIYQQVQRPTTKGRRDDIFDYLVSRLSSQRHGRGIPGAFPALSVGCLDYLNFQRIDGYDGLVQLLIGDERRFILDGLGRAQGLLNVFEEHPSLLKERFTVPLTIFAPARPNMTLTVEELGQLFADFNFRVHPVSQAQALALDKTDIYVRLTNALAQLPPISDHGGMDKRASKVRKASTALTVQSLLLRFVRGATEGRSVQESNKTHIDNPRLTEDSFEDEKIRIVSFLSDLATRMGPQRWRDRNGVHLTSAGWQAFGVIRYDVDHALSLDPLQRSEVIQKLASLEWSRTGPDGQPSTFWNQEVGLGLVRNKLGEMVFSSTAGRTSAQTLVNYLEKITGLEPMLADTTSTPPAAEPQGFHDHIANGA